MNRIGWSIAIIFSAVIALYLLILFDEDKSQQAVADELAITPTYRAVNLDSRIFDEQGVLSHKVEAEKMAHFQPLGFMTFENPVYTVYMDSGEPWQVTAQEGTLYENSRIQLERNVRITNLNKQDYVKEIKTEYIEINLNDKTLLSDTDVEIIGDDFSIRSIGIVGNLATQQYELKEHVQSRFNPKQ